MPLTADPAARNALARKLHDARDDSWRTYDRTTQITCFAWIDRMAAAGVTSGRDVAVAIVNNPAPLVLAHRRAAYDHGGRFARECDRFFAVFAASKMEAA